MQGQICWCKFAMTKFRRNIVIHRSAIVTSGLYQLTSYRVLTKMMIVEEWYLENEYVLIKFQKIYRHSSIYAINVGTNKKRCRCTITKKWKPWIFLILVYLLLLGVSLFIYRTFGQTILKDISTNFFDELFWQIILTIFFTNSWRNFWTNLFDGFFDKFFY